MTGPYALVGSVLAPEPLGRTAVVIENGRIIDVVRPPRSAELPSERREVSEFICPGLIDLQINGAFGIDVGPDAKALEALARELPKAGTTSFLPTLISSPAERYAPFLEALEDASRRSRGARILGAHLEGPFLSPARKGAHDPANLRTPDPGLVREFVDSGMVRMVTLAPERRGIEHPGSSPVTSRSLCLELGQGLLCTRVRGRGVLRTSSLWPSKKFASTIHITPYYGTGPIVPGPRLVLGSLPGTPPYAG